MTGSNSVVPSSAFPCAPASPGFLSDTSSDEGQLLLSRFLSRSRQISKRPTPDKLHDREVASSKGSRKGPNPDVRTIRGWQPESSKDDNGSRSPALRFSFESRCSGELLNSRHSENRGIMASPQDVTQHRTASYMPSSKAEKTRAIVSVDRGSGHPSIKTITPEVIVAARGRLPHAVDSKTNVNRSPVNESSLKKQPKSNTLERSSERSLAAHRLRRSHAAPANYYSNNNYPGYESRIEDKILDVTSADITKDSRPATFLKPRIPSQADSFSLILYSSSDVEIHRKALITLNNLSSLTHAPYAPEDTGAHYALGFKENPTYRMLHVSFDEEEMTAMLRLLAPYYTSFDLTDMSITDQVIEAVKSKPEKQLPSSMATRISRMNQLNKMLEEHGVSDFNTFFLGLQPSGGLSDPSRPTGKVANHIAYLASELLCPTYKYDMTVNYSTIQKSQFPKSSRIREFSTLLPMAAKLKRRRESDIEAFLLDAREGALPTKPYFVQSVPPRDLTVCITTYNKLHNISSTLRNRELGLARGNQLLPRVQNNLKLWKQWKGASNDVINLSWSPDGTRFVVGAAAQCDEHNMQYNRGNNLLIGNLLSNSLRELPDHRIPRPSAHSISEPYLYMSISALQWCNDKLYSASYDNTVKVWDVSTHAKADCVRTLRHESKVHVMAHSSLDRNLLATGTQSAVGLWSMTGIDPTYMALDITRPRLNKSLELVPTSLAWGTMPMTRNFLAAGMSAREDESEELYRVGHLGLWRVNESTVTSILLTPNSQNIFDIKWHPSIPIFATGSSAPLVRNSGKMARDTRSAVRIYDPLRSRRLSVEIDCPALDMNDVAFCPMDANYISASCTDGITYVWDFRKPSNPLHTLPHNTPLNQLDENLEREQADVGVTVALWGNAIDQFYTGGSDGVLKAWNILLSDEDVHVKDLAILEEEIMCGAFSPDKTNLLLGDAAGGIHLLSSGPFSDAEDTTMSFERALEPTRQTGLGVSVNCDPDSGVEAGKRLLSSGQLTRHPVYGVGKGPSYKGPYAAWARPNGTRSELLPITPLTQAVQAIQLDGPPVECRQELDRRSRQNIKAQIRLARIRNQQRNELKRKRNPTKNIPVNNVIDLCSDDDSSNPVWTTSATRVSKKITNIIPIPPGCEVIDLTGDSDREGGRFGHVKSGNRRPTSLNKQPWWLRLKENLEEDHWWPENREIDPNFGDSSI